MFKDIGGYHLAYREETCRNAWSERPSYLCSDMIKNKTEGNYQIFNDSKNTYIDCIPETELCFD